MHQIQALAQVLPTDVAALIGQQLLEVISSSSGKKGLGVIVALAIALFGARNAAGAEGAYMVQLYKVQMAAQSGSGRIAERDLLLAGWRQTRPIGQATPFGGADLRPATPAIPAIPVPGGNNPGRQGG